MSVQQTSQTLDATLEALDSGKRDSLKSADDALRDAKRALETLKHEVRGGQGTEAQLESCQSAQALVETRQASVEAELSALFSAATADLPEAASTTLATVRTNMGHGVPAQYLVVEVLDGGEEWVLLRAALNDERTSADLGLDPNPSHQATLANWRSSSAVATAKANLETNLAAIQTAWTASFAD